jgi:hypothetical protein
MSVVSASASASGSPAPDPSREGGAKARWAIQARSFSSSQHHRLGNTRVSDPPKLAALYRVVDDAPIHDGAVVRPWPANPPR